MTGASVSCVTRDIRVTAQATFLADESDPDDGRYVWSYHIQIENGGQDVVKLLRRTWLITDAQGYTIRVEGDGVVGEQPRLRPGERFAYTSGTPLDTPSGLMRGIYHMLSESAGAEFAVNVPALSLDSPHGQAH